MLIIRPTCACVYPAEEEIREYIFTTNVCLLGIIYYKGPETEVWLDVVMVHRCTEKLRANAAMADLGCFYDDVFVVIIMRSYEVLLLLICTSCGTKRN